jgi:hypothetical protein
VNLAGLIGFLDFLGLLCYESNRDGWGYLSYYGYSVIWVIELKNMIGDIGVV